MKIKFFGATREVTGSKFIIQSEGVRILMECGFYQGRRKETEKKNRNFPFDPGELDFMILSHAHIDHSGNIPNLVKQGFTGDIYTTPATIALLNYMLLDSAHIQERDAEYINRKIKRAGNELIEPLYSVEDAKESLKYFKPLRYHVKEKGSFEFTLLDAGHILGSAEVLIESEGKRLLFTGDLGRNNLPIIRNPEVPEGVDILIMESTYGNRLHRDIESAEDDLEKIIKEAVKKKGKIIIPSFAVERTQEVIYSINSLFIQNRIPEIPIYVDSPLAVNITGVFEKHPECYDEEAYARMLSNGVFGDGKVKYVQDVEESKALNKRGGPVVIISASGMCEHGRILHHLKNSIGDDRNVVLIVGFQAQHTLGRRLVEGKEIVNIFGEPYTRKAQVKVLNEFSAHADRNDLIDFAKNVKPERIFLVHGEEEQIEPLGQALEELGFKVDIPNCADEYEIH